MLTAWWILAVAGAALVGACIAGLARSAPVQPLRPELHTIWCATRYGQPLQWFVGPDLGYSCPPGMREVKR